MRANQFPSNGGVPGGRGGCFGGMRGLATVETVNHPVRLRLPPLLWRGICRVRLSFNVFFVRRFLAESPRYNLLSAIMGDPPTMALNAVV